MVVGVKLDGFRVVLNSFFKVILSESLVPPPFATKKNDGNLLVVETRTR